MKGMQAQAPIPRDATEAEEEVLRTVTTAGRPVQEWPVNETTFQDVVRLFGGEGGDFIGDRVSDGIGIGGMVFLSGWDRVHAGIGTTGSLAVSARPTSTLGRGHDVLCGGPSPDILDGGPGVDTVDGDGDSITLGQGDTFLRTDVAPSCVLF